MTGIPIGAPSQSPEPKSACMLPPAPIAPTIAAESLATGSESTRSFHGLDAGKIPHFGAAARCGEAAAAASEHEGGREGGGGGLHSETAGYLERTSSTKAASRSASAASSSSSTFSAFRSPEWERLKLPTKTVSSQTVTFACM